MNKTDRSELGALRKAAADRLAEDQRIETRKLAIGDVLWSYADDQDEHSFKGTIINESESGLCILTLAPVKTASILRIYGEDGVALRDATVIWCRRSSANIYKSGLLLSDL